MVNIKMEKDVFGVGSSIICLTIEKYMYVHLSEDLILITSHEKNHHHHHNRIDREGTRTGEENYKS
jgi:hypothetical protein